MPGGSHGGDSSVSAVLSTRLRQATACTVTRSVDASGETGADMRRVQALPLFVVAQAEISRHAVRCAGNHAQLRGFVVLAEGLLAGVLVGGACSGGRAVLSGQQYRPVSFGCFRALPAWAYLAERATPLRAAGRSPGEGGCDEF